MTTKQIMEQAIKTYGKAGQLTKAIEEMSELQKELCKAITEGSTAGTLESIAQEMADVEIMLEQLKIIFSNRERVEDWKKLKIARLEYRLNWKEAQA